MVGITLGLPAGYFGGKLDTFLSFLANLVLAFPVILLFYLLVTPEIRVTGIPTYLAAVLFLFPIVFFSVLWNSRYFTDRRAAEHLCRDHAGDRALGLFGPCVQHGPAGRLVDGPEPAERLRLGRLRERPTVFRIVRGIVMDLKSRDYVSAAQTRGEGRGTSCCGKSCPTRAGR